MVNKSLKTTLSIGAGIIGAVIMIILSAFAAVAIHGHNFKAVLLYMIMVFIEFLIGLYFVIRNEEAKNKEV